MQLLPGIKIYQRPVTQTATPRCWLSAGTMPASERGGSEFAYESDAFVPREPWRLPEEPERTLLWSSETPTDHGSWVDIIQIPDLVLASFDEIRDACMLGSPLPTIRKLQWSSDCLQGVFQVLEFVQHLSIDPDYDFEGTGIVAQPPGCLTTTVDSRSNARVGLHIDSWYRAALGERANSPNRICVNLGQSDRFLLLINIDAQGMFGMLESAASQDESRHEISTGLGAAFMRHFTSYPVVRLRIAPGEAYIAPTENLLHDGSTVGARGVDLTLTLRGRFRCGV